MRRAQRRQFRKEIGKEMDREWRIAGHQTHNVARGSMGMVKLWGRAKARGRRIFVADHLAIQILHNYKTKGTIFE